MNGSPGNTAELSDALARVLRGRRHAYNFQWREAARRYPHLTANDASRFFGSDLAPLINAVDELEPELTEVVCDVAVDVGIKATGLRLLGNSPTQQATNNLWRDVFPRLAQHVSADPGGLLAALSNATEELSRHPAARSDKWLEALSELGPTTADSNQLRLVAQVLAWRSGLAHYRSGALQAARQLPEPLRSQVLDLPVPQSFESFAAEVENSPWPLSQLPTDNSTGVIARVGSFRGFGGVFLSPPTLAMRGADLIARTIEGSWLVRADLFGATMHRTDDRGELAGKALRLPMKLSGDSMILGSHRFVDLGDSSPITSVAEMNGALAVTTANSFAIRIVNVGVLV